MKETRHREKEYKSFISLMIMMLMLLLLIFSPAVTYAAGGDSSEETVLAEEELKQYISASNIADQGLDVLFCIDNSRSIWKQQKERNRAVRTLANLAVGRDVRIGGVYFADKIYKKCSLTNLKTEEDISLVLNQFLNLTEQNDNNRDTNIGNALMECRKLFENQDKSRKRIIVVFSDGINENYEGSVDYTKKANKLTEDQVALLKEENIDLYCVFLEKTQSTHSNQQYLKEMVNYFKGGNTYDNRFTYVENNQIASLADKFVGVFYQVQNNMKYTSFNMDSTGKYSFYIPNANVQSVQLFLKNVKEDAQLTIVCNGMVVEKIQTRKDGNFRYVTIPEPQEGTWEVSVSPSSSGISGTIAYYADLKAHAIMNGVRLAKGASSCVTATFTDGDSPMLQLDNSMVVTATVTMDEEKDEIWTGTLSYDDATEKYIGEDFVLPEYGVYKICLTLSYEDFICLEFPFDGQTIEKSAPIFKKPGRELSCHKVEENGDTLYQYIVKKTEWFYDAEGEELALVEYRNLNPENPVTVEESGEEFIITSDKFGEVEFEMKVADASGEMVTAVVSASMFAASDKKLLTIITVGVVVVLILLWMAKSKNNKKKKNDAYQKLIALKQEYDSVNLRIEAVKEHVEGLKGSVDENAYYRYQNCLTNYSENLLEVQIQEMEMEDLISEEKGLLPLDRMDTAVEIFESCENAAADALKATGEGTFEVPSKAEYKKYSAKTLKALAGRRTNAMNRILKAETELKTAAKEYDNSIKAVKNTIEKMENLIDQIEEMMDKPFTCNFILDWDNYRGGKSCKDMKGKNMTGFYGLDQILVITGAGKRTIEEITGTSSGVVIYPYEMDGCEGILLKCMSNLYYREDCETDFHAGSKEVVLLRGGNYVLKLPVLGKVKIQVN